MGVKAAEYGVRTGAMMGGDSTRSLKGMTITLDEDKCIGCGKCVEVCPFKLRILEEGKSSVDPKLCVGCGRCVRECPEGAILIDVQDPELIDKLVAHIEAVVDVEDQSTKIKS